MNYDKHADFILNRTLMKISDKDLEMYKDNFKKDEEEKKRQSEDYIRVYYEALKLQKEGQYELAGKKFRKLGNYLDSRIRANECEKTSEIEMRYKIACNYKAVGDFARALSMYEILERENYKDSIQQIEECRKKIKTQGDYTTYQKAQELEKMGKYELAKIEYEKLGDYLDSKIRALLLEGKEQDELVQRKFGKSGNDLDCQIRTDKLKKQKEKFSEIYQEYSDFLIFGLGPAIVSLVVYYLLQGDISHLFVIGENDFSVLPGYAFLFAISLCGSIFTFNLRYENSENQLLNYMKKFIAFFVSYEMCWISLRYSLIYKLLFIYMNIIDKLS